jgi:hypothetical protein
LSKEFFFPKGNCCCKTTTYGCQLDISLLFNFPPPGGSNCFIHDCNDVLIWMQIFYARGPKLVKKILSVFHAGGCLDGLNIHSNEFAFEGSVSTGQIDRKIQSPLDKVEEFKSIKSGREGTTPLLSVYIGDSVGDLLCLLEADIGVVVGSSTALRKVGKLFGVSFVLLFPGLVEKQRQLTEQEALVFKARSGVLYTVSSWSEIHSFILGNDFK